MSAPQSWKYSLAGGIVGITLGILLFFEPLLSIRLFVYLLGFIAITVAVVILAAAVFFSRGSGYLTPVLLVIGLLILVFGVLAFLKPEILAIFLSIIAALILIIGGLGITFSGLIRGENGLRNILLVLGGCVLVILGFLFLFHSAITATLIVRLLGLFLIVAGIVSVVGAIMQGRQKKGTQPEYIDAQIVEK